MTYIAENLIEIKLQKLIKQFGFELKRFSQSYELILENGFSITSHSMKHIVETLDGIQWDILANENQLSIDIPFRIYDPTQGKMIPNIGK